jgi:hypothetical protein
VPIDQDAHRHLDRGVHRELDHGHDAEPSCREPEAVDRVDVGDAHREALEHPDDVHEQAADPDQPGRASNPVDGGGHRPG